MPLDIKDEMTTRLVNEFARQRGVTKQAAVRMAVQAELQHDAVAIPVRQRLAELWVSHKLPSKTGKVADKTFFDEASGEP